MSNIWYPKQSPVQGMTGLWGGTQGSACAASSGGWTPCPAVSGENSVSMDGDDFLQFGNSDDFIWDGEFTIEFWVYSTTGGGSGPYTMWELGQYGSTDGMLIYEYANKTWASHEGSNNWESTTTCAQNTWMHVALTRNSDNLVTFWLDGVSKDTHTISDPFGSTSNSGGNNATIGATYPSRWIGKMSNVRVVKGQAIYTSNFTPATSNLTLCSQGAFQDNTKVLCCNTGSATGKTKGPNNLTATGNPSGSSDSPWG